MIDLKTPKKQLSITEILQHDTKAHNGARGALARLLRVLMWGWAITPSRYDKYMTKWLADPANGVYQNSKERSTARGNINKEFARPNISWPVLMKALRFHCVWRVDLRIICWKTDGNNATYHKFGFTTGVTPPKNAPTEEEIQQAIAASGHDFGGVTPEHKE